MKKRKIHFKEHAKNQPIDGLKKQKTLQLSESQKTIADEDIVCFLDKGKKEILKLELSLMFDTPKKIESLLVYTNYKMFWWAMEHQDFELMQYVIDKTTERGKFLIVCHNDYELIKKFLELNVEKIKENTYQSISAIKTLKILLDTNSDKSHLITEAVKNFISTIDNLKAANVLKSDLQEIISEHTESVVSNHNSTEELSSIFSADNNNVQSETLGELTNNTDNP